MRMRHVLLTLLPLIALGSLVGCWSNAADRQVEIRVDGKVIPLLTDVLTVREALAEGGVVLDADDRAEPDLWVELEQGMTIRVIRIQEEVIVERSVLPYREQTVKSESLPTGEQKLLQAGKNGQVEVTFRIRFEDGVEVARSVLRQVVIQDPVPQITVVGIEGVVDSVAIQGTIAYLNSGNAWIMRGNSGGRHSVTAEGNLDGRVFALSPDGTYLLYSVLTETVELDGSFNELYLLNVALVNELPRRLPILDVLWAGWSPDGRRIAYSTGAKSGPPGWTAHNDLWLAALLDAEGQILEPDPKRIVAPQSLSAYSWWGTNYAWAPDGQKLAYARADQVGWIDLETRRVFPLAPFPPAHTYREEVWAPAPTWAPDSQFVACAVHSEEPGRSPEESRHFEVWVLDLKRVIRARLTYPIGMWTTPRWSPARGGESMIAYAEADAPFDSYESRYTLKVMDRDGSNKRAVFPAADQIGMVHPIAYDWSPDGGRLVVLHQGDLHLIDLRIGSAESGEDPPLQQQLTGDGQCTRVDWAE